VSHTEPSEQSPRESLQPCDQSLSCGVACQPNPGTSTCCARSSWREGGFRRWRAPVPKRALQEPSCEPRRRRPGDLVIYSFPLLPTCLLEIELDVVTESTAIGKLNHASRSLSRTPKPTFRLEARIGPSSRRQSTSH